MVNVVRQQRLMCIRDMHSFIQKSIFSFLGPCVVSTTGVSVLDLWDHLCFFGFIRAVAVMKRKSI